MIDLCPEESPLRIQHPPAQYPVVFFENKYDLLTAWIEVDKITRLTAKPIERTKLSSSLHSAMKRAQAAMRMTRQAVLCSRLIFFVGCGPNFKICSGLDLLQRQCGHWLGREFFKEVARSHRGLVGEGESETPLFRENEHHFPKKHQKLGLFFHTEEFPPPLLRYLNSTSKKGNLFVQKTESCKVTTD